VARFTLADANELRDWRIFADFAQVLIAIARPLYVGDAMGVDLDQSLYVPDSTTIELCLALFPWAKFRKRKAVVKMHTQAAQRRLHSGWNARIDLARGDTILFGSAQGRGETGTRRAGSVNDYVKSSKTMDAAGNITWVAPFGPFTWGSPYVEGSAWQHRWDVPHDMRGLIESVGGEKAAVEALEQMLAVEPRFNIGVYGTEIHEMSEMAAVKFGQYDHCNQPVHHLLYIFAHAGRADLTQFWVRKVMKCLYTSESFPGDEDAGSMSA